MSTAKGRFGFQMACRVSDANASQNYLTFDFESSHYKYEDGGLHGMHLGLLVVGDLGQYV